MLDERAAEFLASAPQFQSWSTREKAASLNRWLRAQNLTGMRNPQADYRNLRNCLIGQALRHPDHESIPIISSAIFTCIARRLGLAAGCCGLPTHVHVVVFPPAGQTLDGDPRGVLANDEELSKMYFDPWGNDDEIPVERLKTFLSQFGFQSATRSALAMMSDAAVVGRIAGNINETNNLFLENQPAMDDVTPRHDYSQLLDGHGWPIMAASHYASLWSNLLLSQPTHFEWVRHLAGLLDHVSRTYPEDCWLIERYLMPAYDGLGTMRHLDVRAEPRNLLRLIRRTSEARAPVYQRLESENGTEVYRVGDVFRHRRYGYFGIITGWSSQATRKLTIPSTIMEQAQSSARDPRSVTRMMDRLETDDKTYYTYM